MLSRQEYCDWLRDQLGLPELPTGREKLIALAEQVVECLKVGPDEFWLVAPPDGLYMHFQARTTRMTFRPDLPLSRQCSLGFFDTAEEAATVVYFWLVGVVPTPKPLQTIFMPHDTQPARFKWIQPRGAAAHPSYFTAHASHFSQLCTSLAGANSERYYMARPRRLYETIMHTGARVMLMSKQCTLEAWRRYSAATYIYVILRVRARVRARKLRAHGEWTWIR